MKKFVVINELFTASEGWEKTVKCIKKTKEAAEEYCAEQITRNVTDFIEMDIDMGADVVGCKEIISKLSNGWDSFKKDEELPDLMSENCYDFGWSGDYYEFGYDGSDGGNSWAVRYTIHEVEEEE